MSHGATAVALTTSSSGCLCGADYLFGKSSKLLKNGFLNPGIERQCLRHHQAWKRFVFGVRTHVGARKSLRVRAGWLFSKGENKGLNARCEHSESTNEDILIFFFQLDLATQVQRALNMEQYDIAQQLRNKLTEVEEEVVSL